MSFESLLLVLFGVLLLAFFIEALVIYFFKIKLFWNSVGVSIVVNLISFTLFYYLGSAFLTKLGYDAVQLNGLNLPFRGIAFLWWFTTVVEGVVLQLLSPKQKKRDIYLASMIMNAISLFFLHFFIENSH